MTMETVVAACSIGGAVVGAAAGAAGTTYRFGREIGAINASIEALKNNGISEIKKNVTDLRGEFRGFRDFVISKLT